MIRVAELTKRFGPTVAVDQISFGIGRGEVVGFLGPNGAGKTTTIRVLTGYHPATPDVAGYDVQRHSLEVRRNIGYLPQEVPIYPDLRVIEYLRYRAELKGVPARELHRSSSRPHVLAGCYPRQSQGVVRIWLFASCVENASWNADKYLTHCILRTAIRLEIDAESELASTRVHLCTKPK